MKKYVVITTNPEIMDRLEAVLDRSGHYWDLGRYIKGSPLIGGSEPNQFAFTDEFVSMLVDLINNNIQDGDPEYYWNRKNKKVCVCSNEPEAYDLPAFFSHIADSLERRYGRKK